MHLRICFLFLFFVAAFAVPGSKRKFEAGKAGKAGENSDSDSDSGVSLGSSQGVDNSILNQSPSHPPNPSTSGNDNRPQEARVAEQPVAGTSSQVASSQSVNRDPRLPADGPAQQGGNNRPSHPLPNRRRTSRWGPPLQPNPIPPPGPQQPQSNPGLPPRPSTPLDFGRSGKRMRNHESRRPSGKKKIDP
jgi:hypothetical protein